MTMQSFDQQTLDPTRRALILAQLVDCILSWPDASVPVALRKNTVMQQENPELDVRTCDTEGNSTSELIQVVSDVQAVTNPTVNPSSFVAEAGVANS